MYLIFSLLNGIFKINLLCVILFVNISNMRIINSKNKKNTIKSGFIKIQYCKIANRELTSKTLPSSNKKEQNPDSPIKDIIFAHTYFVKFIC